MVNHDHSYKLLFAHPEMVRDLLEGFVREGWVTQLDFSTLERVSGTYVSEHLQGRTGDIVWRVRCGDRDVYIAIEFSRRRIRRWRYAYCRTWSCYIRSY